MRLLNSIILAVIAFLVLSGDADGQRKQSVSISTDDVAFGDN
jgi:hypothetical protein